MIPAPFEAPMALLGLTGNCGPMSVWMVLRLFRKSVSATRVIRACRHTERVGCYGIALALALHKFGLQVTFHTDPDPDIQPLEARCYHWARRRGIPIEPALTLMEMRARVRHQTAIVSLADREGNGHFSPLVGYRRGKLLLPYTNEEWLTVEEFERRWSGPGYPRQCLLVSA